MAIRDEQQSAPRDEGGGFYERARQRLRRALAESPSAEEIRRHHEEAEVGFRAYVREPRHLYRPEYRAASMYYEEDRQRLRRALAEAPSPEEIQRHREEARAAFERYAPPYGRRR